MTTDLQVLYEAVILDHNQRPRNFRALDGGRSAEGDNPLCGDHVIVYVRVDEGVIMEATFQGFGCAIVRASASLMTDSVKGKTVAEAEALFLRVQSPHHVAVRRAGRRSWCTVVARGVRHFPVRVTCATLPWKTLQAAAQARDEVVSTE